MDNHDTGRRPGQLGDTGIIVLQHCGPLKKKGCDCEEDEQKTDKPHSQVTFLPHKFITKTKHIKTGHNLNPIKIQRLPAEIPVQEQQKRKCIQNVRNHNCHHHHLTEITEVVPLQQQKQDLQVEETDRWKILNSEYRVLNTFREDLLFCYLLSE